MMTKKPMRKSDIRFTFFGTGDIGRFVLEELHRAGFIPALVVTAPDAAQGRGLAVLPSPVAELARERGIPELRPARIGDEVVAELQKTARDVFIVADYGLMLPEALLRVPARGVLNMHPSLLPRLRGPSPIRSAILNDERTTGVSVMQIDEEMDHGPLIAQKKVEVREWPPRASELDELLGRAGGVLLAQILPQWVAGDIEARPQNHDLATYTEKFKKNDGLLDLAGDPYRNMLKIRAFAGWPGTYAFFERGGKRIRALILDAHLENKTLVIDCVKPEGKRETKYEEFLRSGAKPASPPTPLPRQTASDA